MTDKMTDNEIIKALECLLELVLVEGCLQRAKTISKALNLINRQKADLENYKQIAEFQQSVSMDKDVEIKRLKAEVEELKNSGIRANSVDDWLKYCNGLRAEAVKEFAHKIESYKTGIFIKGEELIILPLCDFEDIKSEMVGE